MRVSDIGPYSDEAEPCAQGLNPKPECGVAQDLLV